MKRTIDLTQQQLQSIEDIKLMLNQPKIQLTKEQEKELALLFKETTLKREARIAEYEEQLRLDEIDDLTRNRPLTKAEKEKRAQWRKEQAEQNKKETDILSYVMELVWKHLFRYVIQHLRKNFKDLFLMNQEDFLQEAYLEVHRNFGGFDPDKARLTTWSNLHTLHAGQLYYGAYHLQTTDYYSQNVNRIQREMRKAELAHEILSDIELQERLKMPIKTFTECMSLIRRENTPLDFSEEGNIANKLQGEGSDYDSAENIMVKKAEEEEIHNFLNQLTDVQKAIILCRYGFFGEPLKNHEIMEKLGITKDVATKEHGNAVRIMKQKVMNSGMFMNRVIRKEMTEASEAISFLPKEDKESQLEFLDSLEGTDIDF